MLAAVCSDRRDFRQDFERLGDHADAVLASIRRDIRGLVLDRGLLLTNVELKTEQGGLLALVGPPGVGKSAVLAAIAERRRAAGAVLVFSGDLLNAVRGLAWNAVASELRLEHGLRNLWAAKGRGPSSLMASTGSSSRVAARP